MSDFAAALAKFNVTCEQRTRDAFVNITNEVKRSVVEGSELTGAPGQPERAGGQLRKSWVGDFVNADKTVYELTTNIPYAIYVEDGENDFGLFDPSREDGRGGRRAPNGGYHSVALTVASYADRIVPFAVLRAKGESGDAVFTSDD